MRRVERTRTALKKLSKEDDSFVPETPAERIAMMWELTADAWGLRSPAEVGRRLQKHVTKLIRPSR